MAMLCRPSGQREAFFIVGACSSRDLAGNALEPAKRQRFSLQSLGSEIGSRNSVLALVLGLSCFAGLCLEKRCYMDYRI